MNFRYIYTQSGNLNKTKKYGQNFWSIGFSNFVYFEEIPNQKENYTFVTSEKDFLLNTLSGNMSYSGVNLVKKHINVEQIVTESFLSSSVRVAHEKPTKKSSKNFDL